MTPREQIEQLEREADQIEKEIDDRRQRLVLIWGELARRKRDDRSRHTSVTIDADGRYSSR